MKPFIIDQAVSEGALGVLLSRDKQVDVNLMFSSDDHVSAVWVTFADGEFKIVCNEEEDADGAGEHSVLFFDSTYYSSKSERIIRCGYIVSCELISSPGSLHSISALRFSLGSGNDLFISGADMPLTIFVNYQGQHWGCPEYPPGSYNVVLEEKF